MENCIPAANTNLPFRTSITVYINDLVGGVHVGNHVLISYLNETQMRMMTEMGFPTLTVDRTVPINGELHVRYFAEVRYGTPLEIHAGIIRLDSDSFDVGYRIANAGTGKTLLLARLGMTFIDLDSGRKVQVPEKFVAAAQPYLAGGTA